jgi:hypothetical protein
LLSAGPRNVGGRCCKVVLLKRRSTALGISVAVVFSGVGGGPDDVVELGCVDLSYMGRAEDEAIVLNIALEVERFLFSRFQ